MRTKNFKSGHLTLATVSLLMLSVYLPALVLAQPGPPTDIIQAVSPSSANQGESNLLVTITLKSQGAPPSEVIPIGVRIGNLEGDNIQRTQLTVTAVFNIPKNETTGKKTVSVEFPAPNNQTVVFSKENSFEILASGEDDPPTTEAPTIAQHPQSRTVTPGFSATFTVVADGTAPLTYQWQKDNENINATNNTSYTIASADNNDEGAYRCVVSNAYGTRTSNSATLAVTVKEGSSTSSSYVIVDTDQSRCYNNSQQISAPQTGASFYGQDAQYDGVQPSYQDNSDGTITDLKTGLMWQQDPGNKKTYDEAVAGANNFYLAGYNDWRLPTIKELYSLILFNGIDPSGYEGSSTSGLVPFIDTDFFEFEYGNTSAGERIIDSQWITSTEYVGGDNVFGVNFADGRIKGYGTGPMPGQSEGKGFFVIYVRGNTNYGKNNFVDNGDGTISDRATGLMWMENDSQTGMVWQDALSYSENLDVAGYSDWRLPNAKELQSIVDYTRSPSTTGSAAIDPVFNATSITNEAGSSDYPFYWSSTTHVNWRSSGSAVYVAFGRALGYMNSQWTDVHGAGSQRSDPKSGDPSDWPTGNGPQGDAIRIYNFVRCVRNSASVSPSTPVEFGTVESNWLPSESSVTLTWTTVSESNNFGFEVERSVESDWEKIGFVKGSGTTSNANTYQLIDELNEGENNISSIQYRIKQIDNDGSFVYSDVTTVQITKPVKISLFQNYPNPFNPETNISFIMPKYEKVTLKIYNVLGKHITTLVDSHLPAGKHFYKWQADDLPSGIYYYTVKTATFSETKKMVLLR